MTLPIILSFHAWGRAPPESGQTPKSFRRWPNPSTFGRSRANIVRVRPKVVGIGPDLASIGKMRQMPSQIGPDWSAEDGRNEPKSGHSRPNLTKSNDLDETGQSWTNSLIHSDSPHEARPKASIESHVSSRSELGRSQPTLSRSSLRFRNDCFFQPEYQKQAGLGTPMSPSGDQR